MKSWKRSLSLLLATGLLLGSVGFPAKAAETEERLIQTGISGLESVVEEDLMFGEKRYNAQEIGRASCRERV